MKILIIPEFGSQQSGTFRFFETLIRIHLSHEIETSVILTRSQLTPSLVKRLEEQNIKIVEVCNRNRLFKLPYLSLIFDFFIICQHFNVFKPDIIHVSNGTPGLMLGAFIFPCSIVFTMHTYPISKLFISKLSILLTGVHYLISHFVGKKKRILTVSLASAYFIGRYFKVSHQVIDVIPNGVICSDCHSNLSSQTILTIGHVAWYKNPDLWLKIAQKLIPRKSSLKFIWLGEGDLLDEMRTRVSELDLSHQVIFEGNCKNINTYLSQACLYLQPSLVESQGIAVLEAMSYGLPCVVSDVGGLPESVIEGETGFICPNQNLDEFVSKLFILLEDPTLMKRMGELGKQRVSKYFSEATQSEKILNLYHKILEK